MGHTDPAEGRMNRAPFPIDRLRELLAYDGDTGHLRWLVNRNKVRAGSVAGSVDQTGYVCVKIDRRILKAHRVAWAMTHGAWPKDQIDHINGERADNMIANLREASRSENLQNQRRPRSDNKTGYLGVNWQTSDKRWRAQIKAAGRVIYLGQFTTPEAARDAYLAAKKQLHPFQTIVQ